MRRGNLFTCLKSPLLSASSLVIATAELFLAEHLEWVSHITALQVSLREQGPNLGGARGGPRNGPFTRPVKLMINLVS